jgi:PTH2 family peptidyl-tRNA hydrolase
MPGDYQLKQVLVIRNDLNMRKGKMVAQGAHAAMMVLLNILTDEQTETEYEQTGWLNEWISHSMAKICVRADSKEELHQLRDAALEAGLPAYIVTDAGYTEFGGVPTDTALAIGPAPVERLDAITRHLKLL